MRVGWVGIAIIRVPVAIAIISTAICSAILSAPIGNFFSGRVGLRLVVGQQIIFPKNLEQCASELSLIVVTHVVIPHWLSIPIRS